MAPAAELLPGNPDLVTLERTPPGRRHLAPERGGWRRLADATGRSLLATPREI